MKESTRGIGALRWFATGIALLMMATTGAFADGGQESSGNADLDFAQVVFVQATQEARGSWRFDVTVRHNDQGWRHYADAWQVVDPNSGEVLGERILAHPHDTEQPFTRSQSGIVIPEGLERVLVRAKCNLHGFGGREILVDLTRDGGDGFKVTRR